MILVRFTGGLGNQMFQYALGTCLALKNRTELKIDTTLLQDRSQPHEIVTHRKLDLDIFNVTLKEASQKEIDRFNGKHFNDLIGKIYNRIAWQFRKKDLIIEKQRNFDPEILNLKDNKCLVGAWQSEKYFKPVEAEIRKQFTFKTALPPEASPLLESIRSQGSLCIHVRRGDYVTSPVYSKTIGALPKEYFYEGFKYISSKEKINHIFIFSDDLAWCRENFSFPVNTTFVNDEFNCPKFVSDMYLMTQCRHFIISNSSFSWWAAWLSTYPEKKVVAPLNWFKEKSYNSKDLIPESWIKLDHEKTVK